MKSANFVTFYAFLMESRIWTRNFVLLTASNFLMFLTYYAVISTLPLFLVENFHIEKTIVGLLLSAYTIASVSVRPISGFTLDRFGRKQILIIALVLYALFYLGYIVALGIVSILLLRIVHGIIWGAVTISNTTQTLDIIPVEKKGEGIGYYALSTTLAMSLGPIIGLFFYHSFGYLTLFVLTFFIGVVGLVCVLSAHLPEYVFPKERPKLSWQSLFDKKSLLPSVNLLIFMFTYGGLLPFVSLYGKEIGVHNTSFFFFVFSLGIFSSRFTSGKVFDRQGPRLIITICSIVLIAGFLILAFFKNSFGFYLASFVIGFGIGVVFPVFQAMVNNVVDPEHRGAANSTIYTALDLGMGLGMFLIGLIAQHTSLSFAFAFSGGVCLFALLVFRGFTVIKYEENVDKLRPK